MLNILIISDIPPHFGTLFFVSPSNVSLINLRREHSEFDKPSKIGLIFINPRTQVTINIKFSIETTIKNGILNFGSWQHLKHLQSQQAIEQNINQPGIHKTPNIQNMTIGAR